MKKQIYSADGLKIALINRELYSDGYNYYITILNLNETNNIYFIDDKYKQKETILSYSAALMYADNILNKKNQ